MRYACLVYFDPKKIFNQSQEAEDALRDSAGACVSALAGGRYRPEAPTSGGPGRNVVEAAALLHRHP